ncbi:MAG: GNAT family N-acetyltransferase [Prolixibacteraceae bacterium]|nr:GNAT family N-acetyltransferase [Prolixibacteraceae bacterium]
MKLIEVSSRKTKKLFHQLPYRIYENDSNYIFPLKTMVEENFDPSKNSFFKHGIATRWVLVDLKGKPIGRIAAFIDYDKFKVFDQPTGNIGFFECINDKQASEILFITAREWLKEKGAEAMDGPANLGENYMNHGLLAWGFVQQAYGMPYNPPYYVDLFKDFGFQVYYEQYSYHIDYTKPFPERFWKIAEWVNKKPQFSFRHFDWAETDKFISDFCKVYEGAWQKHEHYKPLDPEELKNFIKSSKLVLDPKFVFFAYADNEPIALFVMLPDFNQALKTLGNGKLNLINIIKLLRFIKKGRFTRTRIIIMGVVEKYQKSGIESAIFYELDRKIMPHKPQYKEVEISWAGDFNPKIIAIYKATGGVHSKTHYQMRYLFDRDKPFTRAQIIND